MTVHLIETGIESALSSLPKGKRVAYCTAGYMASSESTRYLMETDCLDCLRKKVKRLSYLLDESLRGRLDRDVASAEAGLASKRGESKWPR